ncbi:AAA family ATPase [Serratia marcescens]|uniref:AAA family ATPase n=1 Tax=Serratia marcescens TaxID=615 RepID=UPI00186625A3|nr:AAA family ATPase [Serratia marcescens]MBN5273466.1 AAA family ATPase [Serratia marcescens]MBN5277860.1 AAA family ATPase [Serratia marcescens]MBN5305325.1 AAA family ATPase [Serratia marcescens]MBN5363504.1 AAA family ATPase [Serratia marcescens]MBN5423844.1 AAA family ATPase [Serratia marcescens]
MKFNIDIKNFGKIKDAKINIRPFTIIAGPNSSGKSFVTKALYSFFNTINNDHVTSLAFTNITNIKTLAIGMSRSLSRPSVVENEYMSMLLFSIERVEKVIDEEFRSNTLMKQISGMTLLDAAVKEVSRIYEELREEVQDKAKYSKVRVGFDSIRVQLSMLQKLVATPNYFLADEIEKGFINEIKENFQVSKLSDLKNFNAETEQEICFDFDSLGDVHINNERVKFRLTSTSIDDFQRLYNVVYLESPIYWKLKDSLDSLRMRNRYFHFLARQKNDTLSGVPKHFYDLLDLLTNKAKDDSSLCESPYSKDIKKAIGGDILISPTGEILFKEKGSPRSINLHSTALGITNLGIISLLLERGVIAKGSYLFIDEPEVNLHPSWQKVMIETLFNLSKNGISVVVASHSIDMMKCIENIMDDNEELVEQDHFGINQLSSHGISVSESDNPLKRIAAIKMDLNKSFYEMFIDGNI